MAKPAFDATDETQVDRVERWLDHGPLYAEYDEFPAEVKAYIRWRRKKGNAPHRFYTAEYGFCRKPWRR